MRVFDPEAYESPTLDAVTRLDLERPAAERDAAALELIYAVGSVALPNPEATPTQTSVDSAKI